MNFEKVVEGIEEYFEGEYFCIGRVVDKEKVKGDEQDPSKAFSKIFVDQGGGGMTGDDFHGTAYFHLGKGRYATASY